MVCFMTTYNSHKHVLNFIWNFLLRTSITLRGICQLPNECTIILRDSAKVSVSGKNAFLFPAKLRKGRP